MSQKPDIQIIEQQTTPHLGRDRVQRKVTAPLATAWAGAAEAAQTWDNALQQRQETQNAAREKYHNQLVQNWEEQLANQYKELGGKLDISQDPAEYDILTNQTLHQMKMQGRAFLGEELYKKWQAENGSNYYRAIQIDVENKKQGLYHKLAFATAQDNVKQKAYNYGYAQTPEDQAQIDAEFALFLQDQDFTPAEQKTLLQQYKQESTSARLHYLLDNAPQEIASVNEKGQVVSVMDDPKKFDHLSVEEKILWKNKALKKQQTQQKGTAEDLTDLYDWAFELAENNPQELQKQVLLFKQNPFSYQKFIQEKTGVVVPVKKLSELMNFTQTQLLDDPATTAGQQKRNAFGVADTVYKNFRLDHADGKTKINNKDLDNTEALYEAVSELRAGMKSGQFTKSDKEKVNDYNQTLTRLLGQKLLDADYAHNFLWTASGEHILQNETAIFAQGAMLGPQETAEIYMTARALAAQDGLDLTQDYEGENALRLEKVFSDARKLYYHRVHGVPVEYADAYLYDHKLVELQKQNKSVRSEHIRQVKAAAQTYQAQTLQGKNARVSKNKDGQIEKVYFEE